MYSLVQAVGDVDLAAEQGAAVKAAANSTFHRRLVRSLTLSLQLLLIDVTMVQSLVVLPFALILCRACCIIP